MKAETALLEIDRNTHARLKKLAQKRGQKLKWLASHIIRIGLSHEADIIPNYNQPAK